MQAVVESCFSSASYMQNFFKTSMDAVAISMSMDAVAISISMFNS